MPSVREFLERLRPSATPGAPSASGVPADQVKEISAELEGLFAAIEGTQAEVERIREAAETESARMRQAAAERATAIVDEAVRTAEAQRAAARTAVQEQTHSVVDEILRGAEEEAALIRERAHERIPAFAQRVTAQARSELSHTRAGVS